MNDEKWLDDIRSKMDRLEKPEPEGLWEEIAGALDAAPAPPAVNILPRRRRWWRMGAAAVALLTVAVGGWLYMSHHTDTVGALTAKMETATPPTGHKPAAPQAPTGSSPAVTLPVAEHPILAAHRSGASAPALPALPDSTAPATTVTPEDTDTATQRQSPRPAGMASYPPTGLIADARRGGSHAPRRHQRPTAGGRVALGMAIDGGMSLRTDGTGARDAGLSAPVPPIIVNPNRPIAGPSGRDGDSDPSRPIMPDLGFGNPDTSPGTYSLRHRQPVRFTASVSYRLSRSFSVETGLTYTRLRSEVEPEQTIVGGTQTLRYIGIPLGLRYTFAGWDRLSLYASASVLAEKCVYGRLSVMRLSQSSTADGAVSHTDVRVRPLQMSAAASLGAQFAITPAIGIYAEPGIGYYFDNGSDVNTIHTDHPLNLSLNVGLRLTLGSRSAD